jgi:hypothetical protein
MNACLCFADVYSLRIYLVVPLFRSSSVHSQAIQFQQLHEPVHDMLFSCLYQRPHQEDTIARLQGVIVQRRNALAGVVLPVDFEKIALVPDAS